MNSFDSTFETMEHVQADTKLTVAASEYLDEHLEEVRRRIVSEAVRASRGRPYTATLGVEDIKLAKNRLELVDRSALGAVTRDVSRVLHLRPRIVALAGLGYLAVGLLLSGALAFGLILNGDDESQDAGFVLVGASSSFVGLLLGIISIDYFMTRQRKKYHRAQDFSNQFVLRMKILEDEIFQLVLSDEGDRGHSINLPTALAGLVAHGIWARSDADSFRRLMGLRNLVVYEKAMGLPRDQVPTVLAEVTRLHGLLASSVARMSDGSDGESGVRLRKRDTNA